MWYSRFKDVLDMVIRRGKNCVIIKRGIKNAFKNVLVALHYQWLLDFMWKNKYYKETYFLFSLSRALFIFNLFGESLHWILISYLC